MQHFASLFYRWGLAATSAQQEVTAQALQVASAAAAVGTGTGTAQAQMDLPELRSDAFAGTTSGKERIPVRGVWGSTHSSGP